MAVCKSCGEEVDELVSAQVGGKDRKVCTDCAELAAEEAAVGEESEAVVQRMMEFKGRR
jgi:ribosome-binding protein aMBF1 (putative translation factor)